MSDLNIFAHLYLMGSKNLSLSVFIIIIIIIIIINSNVSKVFSILKYAKMHPQKFDLK